MIDGYAAKSELAAPIMWRMYLEKETEEGTMYKCTKEFCSGRKQNWKRHEQAVTKKVNNLDLGGEGELGKAMGPESIFKSRLCMSFLAGE